MGLEQKLAGMVLVFQVAAVSGCSRESEGPCNPSPCHPDAACDLSGEEVVCTCRDGYIGDGEACSPVDAWTRHEIGDLARATYILVEDIDGDDLPDVLAANTSHTEVVTSDVVLFHNLGNEAWARHSIITEDDPVPLLSATGIAAARIDADAMMDLAVASSEGDVVWFRAGDGPADAWARHTVHAGQDDKYYKLYALDANGDDHVDLVAGGSLRAALFVNPGDPTAPGATWTRHRLPAGTGSGIHLEDMDGDGELDVLSASFASSKVMWLAFSWQGDGFVFEETIVDASLPGALDPVAVDADRDGHKDVVVSTIFNPGVHWFRCPLEDGQPWTAQKVHARFEATDLFAGDVDGDGHDDVAAAGFAMQAGELPESLAWFAPRVEGTGVSWDRHYITYGRPDGPGDNALVDMDADGDLDLVTAVYIEGKLQWYENRLREQ